MGGPIQNYIHKKRMVGGKQNHKPHVVIHMVMSTQLSLFNFVSTDRSDHHSDDSNPMGVRIADDESDECDASDSNLSS